MLDAKHRLGEEEFVLSREDLEILGVAVRSLTSHSSFCSYALLQRHPRQPNSQEMVAVCDLPDSGIEVLAG